MEREAARKRSREEKDALPVKPKTAYYLYIATVRGAAGTVAVLWRCCDGTFRGFTRCGYAHPG